MKFLKNYVKWLYPGLGVKRWLLAALLGVLLFVFGVALLLETRWWAFLLFIGSLLEEGIYSFHAIAIVGILLIASGLLLTLFSLRRVTRSVIKAIIPDRQERLVEVILEKRKLQRGPKIVAIGGGTGLPVLLRGLKNYSSNITALVVVTDDGGCSGKIRGELGMLPPGDLRNNLVALADKETLLESLLNYRFPEGTALAGRNLGNLLLAAMTDMTGNMQDTLKELSRVLAIRGTVLPATLEDVRLSAEMEDGSQIEGETKIVAHRERIKKMRILPEACQPVPDAVRAIEEADFIVLGPGSLYTSVLPNLLIRGIADAIGKTHGEVYYICNVMTQPGETDGYSVSDHLRAIRDHAPQLRIKKVFANTGRIPQELIEKYEAQGAAPVQLDEKKLLSMGVQAARADMISTDNWVRHDPEKLGRAVMREIVLDMSPGERLKVLDLFFDDRYKGLMD